MRYRGIKRLTGMAGLRQIGLRRVDEGTRQIQRRVVNLIRADSEPTSTTAQMDGIGVPLERRDVAEIKWSTH